MVPFEVTSTDETGAPMTGRTNVCCTLTFFGGIESNIYGDTSLVFVKVFHLDSRVGIESLAVTVTV